MIDQRMSFEPRPPHISSSANGGVRLGFGLGKRPEDRIRQIKSSGAW